jgi:hypothetical protein
MQMHLLNTMPASLEKILQCIIERIAHGDPPFLVHQAKNVLTSPLDGKTRAVQTAQDVTEFMLETFPVLQSERHCLWKDVKKQNVKHVMLYKFCKTREIPLINLFLDIANKRDNSQTTLLLESDLTLDFQLRNKDEAINGEHRI